MLKNFPNTCVIRGLRPLLLDGNKELHRASASKCANGWYFTTILHNFCELMVGTMFGETSLEKGTIGCGPNEEMGLCKLTNGHYKIFVQGENISENILMYVLFYTYICANKVYPKCLFK